MLTTLKRLGMSLEDLKTIYIGFIRPLLEYAVPVWHPGSAVVESTQPESESKTMTFESESKSESLASESRVRVPRSESRVRVLYEIWPYRLVWWISPILIILLLLYTQDLVHVRSRLILSVFTLKFHVKNSSINAFWKYIVEINLQRNWISLKCTNNILHCHNL